VECQKAVGTNSPLWVQDPPDSDRGTFGTDQERIDGGAEQMRSDCSIPRPKPRFDCSIEPAAGDRRSCTLSTRSCLLAMFTGWRGWLSHTWSTDEGRDSEP